MELHTAIIMPFKDGKIDYTNLDRIIEFQYKNDIDGIILHGTTGESPTITHEEFIQSSEVVLQKWKGKLLITIGISQNSTSDVLLKQNSLKIQPDFFLVTPPSYSKPSQEGIFQHFKVIAHNSKVPILIYNVPSRTVADIQPQTLLRIASELPNIAGMKDATGSFARFSEEQYTFKNFRKPFLFLTGDDQTTPHFLMSGGHGVISVLSNIIPKEVKIICNLSATQSVILAFEHYMPFFNLIRLLFTESNPMPVKYVMYKMGFCELEYRLPMCTPSVELMKEIDEELLILGLIK